MMILLLEVHCLLVGVGIFNSDLEAVDKCNKIEKVYMPNMDNHKVC